MIRILFLLTFALNIISGQIKDPNTILNKVKENFNRIKNYEVDVHIKVDVNFLKIPESNAKIYFKQPDKVKIESKQFALLPKEGLYFSPGFFIGKKYTAFFGKEDTVNGYKTYVIKIIPIGNNSNIVLTTLWIDEQKYIIRKVETSTRVNGTFSIYLEYNLPGMKYPLPGKMIFTFNTERLKFHSPFQGNLNKGTNSNQKKPGNSVGKVIISYRNYIVNRGIPDSVFKVKK